MVMIFRTMFCEFVCPSARFYILKGLEAHFHDISYMQNRVLCESALGAPAECTFMQQASDPCFAGCRIANGAAPFFWPARQVELRVLSRTSTNSPTLTLKRRLRGA